MLEMIPQRCGEEGWQEVAEELTLAGAGSDGKRANEECASGTALRTFTCAHANMDVCALYPSPPI